MAPRVRILALLIVVAFGVVLVCSIQGVASQGDGSMVRLQSSGGADRAFCLTRSRCYHKILTCPKACKKRRIVGANRRVCFIDCTHKCQATCRRRRPACNEPGSMCFEPRLVGGDSTVFYFHGRKDEDFCLVTDRRLHVNGHFIGHRPEGRKRDFTWVQAVGVLFGGHEFSLGAKKVSHWDDDVDQMLFSYDKLPFVLEEESEAAWTSEDGQLSVQRTYSKNSVEVTIHEIMSVLVEVVPVTPEYSKVHNYQLPAGNAFAHLDLQFIFYNLSADVNGVLGETYQPHYVSRAKKGVPMPILGGEDRFFATGLLNADCKANQFSVDSILQSPVQILQPFKTKCSSENSGSGMVCRR